MNQRKLKLKNKLSNKVAQKKNFQQPSLQKNIPDSLSTLLQSLNRSSNLLSHTRQTIFFDLPTFSSLSDPHISLSLKLDLVYNKFYNQIQEIITILIVQYDLFQQISSDSTIQTRPQCIKDILHFFHIFRLNNQYLNLHFDDFINCKSIDFLIMRSRVSSDDDISLHHLTSLFHNHLHHFLYFYQIPIFFN